MPQVVADVRHLRSVWGALASRYGIDVEMHYNTHGDLFIWTRSGLLEIGDKGSGPALLGALMLRMRGREKPSPPEQTGQLALVEILNM